MHYLKIVSLLIAAASGAEVVGTAEEGKKCDPKGTEPADGCKSGTYSCALMTDAKSLVSAESQGVMDAARDAAKAAMGVPKSMALAAYETARKAMKTFTDAVGSESDSDKALREAAEKALKKTEKAMAFAGIRSIEDTFCIEIAECGEKVSYKILGRVFDREPTTSYTYKCDDGAYAKEGATTLAASMLTIIALAYAM